METEHSAVREKVARAIKNMPERDRLRKAINAIESPRGRNMLGSLLKVAKEGKPKRSDCEDKRPAEYVAAEHMLLAAEQLINGAKDMLCIRHDSITEPDEHIRTIPGL